MSADVNIDEFGLDIYERMDLLPLGTLLAKPSWVRTAASAWRPTALDRFRSHGELNFLLDGEAYTVHGSYLLAKAPR